jgi:DNA-binding response OmpR family regulator
VLVVEDDPGIVVNLRRALEHAGYEVETAGTGEAALDACMLRVPSLVLLDLGLPDLDGVEVCRQIRKLDIQSPIVMLTARTEEIDVVVGLDAGAVDYVTKPFRLAELLARLRAHLRHSTDAGRGRIVVGDLVIDLDAHRALLSEDELDLRPKEWDLLVALAERAGQAVTREELMAQVWDDHWFGSTKTLDVHVAAIRRKLGERGGEASRITTLRGVGYRLEQPDELRA